MTTLIHVLPGVLAAAAYAAGDGYVAPIESKWPPFSAIFFALVFVAMVGLAAFKNPHRTYLD